MSKKGAGGRGGRGMTRRELLHRFGVIGGTSLVWGAMDSLELWAAPIGPKPELRGSQEGVRVVILGAGVSGLITAYELRKLGYDARILEARDRVGGLNWSVTTGSEHTELGGGERQVCAFDEGQYFNAGPWRLPNAHHGILGYCKELGVRLERFVDDDTVMFGEDPSLGALRGERLMLREVQSDMWGQTAELLAKAVDQGSLDSMLTAEDKDRLITFLVRAGYLGNADLLYSPDPEVRGSADSYDLRLLLETPFAQGVRSLTSGTGGPDPVFQPTGGMMQIPLAFQRVLGDVLTLGAEVVSVRQTEDEVRVVYKDTGTGATTELVADYVVSCLPMSILKKLDVNFLSSEMAEAVSVSSHSNTAKMGLQMARRFWEEDDGIYGGHLRYIAESPVPREGPGGGGGRGGRGGGGGRGPSPIPQFSYPSNDYGSKKGVLLGYYGNASLPGLDGTPLDDSPIDARVEHVLTHASKVHPQMREEFESAYSVWWPKVAYSEGAWAGNPGPLLDTLGKADGRLYIGAAGASSHPSWQEGAVESAWRTIESIHIRVSSGA